MSLEGDSSFGGPDCPHIAAMFTSDTKSAALLERFNTVIRWGINRAQTVAYPSKRRKVTETVPANARVLLNNLRV